MPEISTTSADNPADGAASDTTAPAGTDNQTGKETDNLDGSKSPETTSADGDKKPADEGKKDDTPASTFDDDIDDWIEKRGLPKPTDDAQKQKYQDLRNEQRSYTRDQQAKKDAAELGKTVADTKPETKNDDDDDLDPLEKRQNKIENELAAERATRQQSEFYATNKVTDAEHKAVLEIYKEKVNRPTTPEGKQKAFELWSHPDSLSDLLDLARARIAKTTDNSAIADEAAQKERERIARESQAKSPGRSATTTTTPDLTNEQARTEALKARYSSK